MQFETYDAFAEANATLIDNQSTAIAEIARAVRQAGYDSEFLDETIADICEEMGTRAANQVADNQAEAVIAAHEELRASVNNHGLHGQIAFMIWSDGVDETRSAIERLIREAAPAPRV